MTVIGTILIGSQNYSLDIPESDHDYKIIVTPNFNELYLKKDLNGAALPSDDPEHYSYMDVRTFANNLAKGNPNAIEMLYSVDINVNEELKKVMDVWRELYKKQYILNVWPYFVEAITGMCYNGFKAKGMTTKTVSRAIYFYRLIETIYKDDGVIDESTMRNDYCCSFARDIRLNMHDDIFETDPTTFLNQVKEAKNWVLPTSMHVVQADDFVKPAMVLVRRFM